jgi:hypothetical protein
MFTDEATENLDRVFRAVAAGLGSRVNMQATFNSTELHGVRKAQVVEIVQGVLDVIDTTDEEVRASLMRMIDEAYHGRAESA